MAQGSGNYSGPGFGGVRRHPSTRQSPSNIEYDDEFNENDPEANFITSEGGSIEIGSHITHRSMVNNSQKASSTRSSKKDIVGTHHNHGHHGHHGHHNIFDQVTAPTHDPAGRPLRRHGTETFGDVLLHPIRELELHRKRIKEFDEEKKEFDASHPDMLDPNVKLEPKPTVKRIIVHFLHLVGDQDLDVTDDLIRQLWEPLSLTQKDVEKLKNIDDTDSLIEFFHNSKRDYSLKIHKTVDIRTELKEAAAEFKKKTRHNSSGSEDSIPRQKTLMGADTQETREQADLAASPLEVKPHNDSEKLQVPELKEGLSEAQSKALEEKQNIADHEILSRLSGTVIKLNENVYLEIKYSKPEEEEAKEEKKRRQIFILPDADLSDDTEEETKATWVELFGDLFYVGWLTTFTHANHITGQEQLGIYAAWFVVMWWTWCSSALYSSRYDSADVMHHIYKVIELCGLVGMAASSNGFWKDDPKGFIIGYMVMKAVLLIEYSVVLVAAIISGSFARKPLMAYVGINMIAMIMWGCSLLFPANQMARYLFWYISIGAEFIVNVILKRNKQTSLAASHLGERFGLFTLIILGENCMGFITMVSDAEAHVPVVVSIMFGLIIIFNFFFMYFDDFNAEVLSEIEVSQLWVWLHFPLHLCQVAFGIAMIDVITIFRLGWDDGEAGAELMREACHEVEAELHLPATSSELAGHSLIAALRVASGASGDAEACEEIPDTRFVFQAFWISAGLILCLNAMIKLVNTPIGAKWSYIICGSRFLNAILFFGLSAATYDNLTGISMLAIMMCCLLLQSAIDLTD
ncbi:bacterial low temperature requirement A protein-domain-containing protein [Phycomyces nitens]|nr:bacterial low temperature requirement A protein-domain-containing protein [Phycomyces nitens]